MILFNNDIKEVIQDLEETIFPERWPEFPREVRMVLVNMRFQLGPDGFRGFRKMIQTLREDPPDYPEAARQMQDSLWFTKQTPQRAKELVKIILAAT